VDKAFSVIDPKITDGSFVNSIIRSRFSQSRKRIVQNGFVNHLCINVIVKSLLSLSANFAWLIFLELFSHPFLSQSWFCLHKMFGKYFLS